MTKNMFIIALYIIIVIYFIYTIYKIYNSNKKRKEKFIEMIKGLKIGKKVVSIGGIHGTISKIEETTIDIRIDKGVFLTLSKDSISWVEE